MVLSADFTVNGNANPARHSAAYASTVNLALASLDGVAAVEWSIVGTSKSDQAVPTLTLGGVPLGATATFALPADPSDGLGRAFRIRCLVSSQYDTAESYGVVGVLNVAGLLPACVGEQLDRDATHGITDDFNQALATLGGGGTLTGSGTASEFAVWSDTNELSGVNSGSINIGWVLANGNNADGDRIRNVLDPVDPQDVDTLAARNAALAALTATDIAFDDTSSQWGGENIQETIDGMSIYVNDLLNGKVVAQSGNPAAVAGYSVVRPRTEDGALVTALSTDRWRVLYEPALVTHAAASSVEIGSFYIANSRSAVLAVCIKAHETSTIANGAELFFRVVVSTNGSGVVTLSTTRSTSGTNSSVTGGVPEALPATLPGWISNYATLVTIGVGTANRVKFNVAQNSTTSVKWALTVDAEVVA